MKTELKQDIYILSVYIPEINYIKDKLLKKHTETLLI